MRRSKILFNILYNPQRYCDASWLNTLVLTSGAPAPSLPAAINTLLLRQINAPDDAIAPEQFSELSWHVMEQWAKLREAAFMVGLKQCAPSLMRHPALLKALTPTQRGFFYLPIYMPPAASLPEHPREAEILALGAKTLFQVLAGSLQSPLQRRLRLIFPRHCLESVSPAPVRQVELSATLQAINYA